MFLTTLFSCILPTLLLAVNPLDNIEHQWNKENGSEEAQFNPEDYLQLDGFSDHEIDYLEGGMPVASIFNENPSMPTQNYAFSQIPKQVQPETSARQHGREKSIHFDDSQAFQAVHSAHNLLPNPPNNPFFIDAMGETGGTPSSRSKIEMERRRKHGKIYESLQENYLTKICPYFATEWLKGQENTFIKSREGKLIRTRECIIAMEAYLANLAQKNPHLMQAHPKGHLLKQIISNADQNEEVLHTFPLESGMTEKKEEDRVNMSESEARLLAERMRRFCMEHALKSLHGTLAKYIQIKMEKYTKEAILFSAGTYLEDLHQFITDFAAADEQHSLPEQIRYKAGKEYHLQEEKQSESSFVKKRKNKRKSPPNLI